MIERLHLEIIKKVQELGTLTKAANVLCLTQSALSHSIKKLEHGLQIKIWEKKGRQLRLTEAGRHILHLSDRVLPQLTNCEELMRDYADGKRGNLRIGMECHPCYQWFLKIVPQFLDSWPSVDMDVKQAFQFGGIKALSQCEIDLLITPDPIAMPGLDFCPVFDFEMVLVVPASHSLAEASTVEPSQLASDTLITYPVSRERLDIYTHFFVPANCAPKSHKTVETTDILLQMVASGRGVTALPSWLVEDYQAKLDIRPVRFGQEGIQKSLFIGTRCTDSDVDYINSFKSVAMTVN